MQQPFFFKFQSDSINTTDADNDVAREYPLNSNLILLILDLTLEKFGEKLFKFQSDSINTLCLRDLQDFRHFPFKFQSDSINTDVRTKYQN